MERHNRDVAKKRGRENAYDMVLSLGAVLIVVVVVLVITWRPQQTNTQQVDYQSAISNASTSTNWTIFVPAEIPTDYQVTSARFEAESYGAPGDSRWYLGFTSSTNAYISLWQSDGPTKKIKSAATNSAQCTQTQIIAGSEWEKCSTEKPETRALVKTQGDLITIVAGTATWDELVDFVDSLVEVK